MLKYLAAVLVILNNLMPGLNRSTDNLLPEQVKLEIKIQPDSGCISGTLTSNKYIDTVFNLYKGLRIENITVNGRNVPFYSVSEPRNSISKHYKINLYNGQLVIKFSGKIDMADLLKNSSGYNRVSPDLIELTDYFVWYPRFEHSPPLRYRFSVDLPEYFKCLTNATLKDSRIRNHRNITDWLCDTPVYNITIIASSGFKMKRGSFNGYNLEIYYKLLPDYYVDSMVTGLGKTLGLYNDLYGISAASKLIRICYAPRSAGGYARDPLIVVSEKFATDQMGSLYGFARDFRLNAHELAHLWSKASTATPDDWMNEGFAEFSALIASEKFIGTEFSDLLVKEYEGIVKSSRTRVPIIETNSDSWDHEVNRYYKPALLLDTLMVKYGYAKVRHFFNQLYVLYLQREPAITDTFLLCLEENFGKDEMEAFKRDLYTADYPPVKNESIVICDPGWSGVWTGPLTQFGATSKFVLRLKADAGGVSPGLDSPDQGAFNIPITDLSIRKDSISFVVGVASGRYVGRLDSTNHTIIGTWSQRGADYPLILSGEN